MWRDSVADINAVWRNVVVIIQARMGSPRFPGKVLSIVEKKPLLWHVVSRVRLAAMVKDIVIATTNLRRDRHIVEFAAENGLKSYMGSVEDVLDRYYRAALEYKADVIVRITADCPFVDPVIIDDAVKFFLANSYDYVSTAIKPAYPDGLGAEVFSFAALEKAWQEARLLSEREHVMSYIWKNPHLFKTKNLENKIGLSDMKWTVDEARDLNFVRGVYKELYRKSDKFSTADVLKLIEGKKSLASLNMGIAR